MRYLKLFEDFKPELIVYHGGNIKLTNKNIKVPIFTTPIPELANWYASNWAEIGKKSWVSTLKIKINNPLISKKDNFNKWIPILDEANINYEFDVNGDEYDYFKSSSIRGYGYMEENMNDLIYIPGFIDIAIKHGYDGIYGFDSMLSGLKEIYIPFLRSNIKVIKTEEFDWDKHDCCDYP